MNLKTTFCLLLLVTATKKIPAQVKRQPVKISHAEPLYVDLIRDLGARKGEKEINIAADFSGRQNYNEYTVLAEYEFAPVNRLGLEVETGLSFFSTLNKQEEVAGGRPGYLKLSAQYSFFISEKHQTTLAVGYTQAFGCNVVLRHRKGYFLSGIDHNPFFIAAKRWQNNIHTLLYAGPLISCYPDHAGVKLTWQFNYSVHYAIHSTAHLAGVEINGQSGAGTSALTIRPQVKLKVADRLAIGLVTGFPLKKEKEGFSSFIRIIYEP